MVAFSFHISYKPEDLMLFSQLPVQNENRKIVKANSSATFAGHTQLFPETAWNAHCIEYTF